MNEMRWVCSFLLFPSCQWWQLVYRRWGVKSPQAHSHTHPRTKYICTYIKFEKEKKIGGHRVCFQLYDFFIKIRNIVICLGQIAAISSNLLKGRAWVDRDLVRPYYEKSKCHHYCQKQPLLTLFLIQFFLSFEKPTISNTSLRKVPCFWHTTGFYEIL